MPRSILATLVIGLTVAFFLPAQEDPPVKKATPPAKKAVPPAKKKAPAAATLRSGPQADTILPGSFDTLIMSGKYKGRQHCLVCEYGLYPVVMAFVREPETPREWQDDGPLAYLLTKLDEAPPKHPDEYLKAFVVFLSAFAPTIEAEGKEEARESAAPLDPESALAKSLVQWSGLMEKAAEAGLAKDDAAEKGARTAADKELAQATATYLEMVKEAPDRKALAIALSKNVVDLAAPLWKKSAAQMDEAFKAQAAGQKEQSAQGRAAAAGYEALARRHFDVVAKLGGRDVLPGAGKLLVDLGNPMYQQAVELYDKAIQNRAQAEPLKRGEADKAKAAELEASAAELEAQAKEIEKAGEKYCDLARKYEARDGVQRASSLVVNLAAPLFEKGDKTMQQAALLLAASRKEEDVDKRAEGKLQSEDLENEAGAYFQLAGRLIARGSTWIADFPDLGLRQSTLLLKMAQPHLQRASVYRQSAVETIDSIKKIKEQFRDLAKLEPESRKKEVARIEAQIKDTETEARDYQDKSARATQMANEITQQGFKLVERERDLVVNRDQLLKHVEGRADKLGSVVLTSYPKAGPRDFQISPDAEVTLIFYYKHKVLLNQAFAQDRMTQADVDGFLARVDSILESWKK